MPKLGDKSFLFLFGIGREIDRLLELGAHLTELVQGLSELRSFLLEILLRFPAGDHSFQKGELRAFVPQARKLTIMLFDFRLDSRALANNPIDLLSSTSVPFPDFGECRDLLAAIDQALPGGAVILRDIAW